MPQKGRPRLVPEDYVQASFRCDRAVYNEDRIAAALSGLPSIGAFMREAVEEKLAKMKRRKKAS